MTTRVRRVELTIPPIIGAAIRFMTSAPVPVVHMIGINPPMIAATVIILGRSRCALHDRFVEVLRPGHSTFAHTLLIRLVEIDEHVYF